MLDHPISNSLWRTIARYSPIHTGGIFVNIGGGLLPRERENRPIRGEQFLRLLWGIGKHLAFGYLVYSLLEHREGRSPTGRNVGVLLVGTMFPDIIDKPLTFVGILEYGRSFAHSLITASVIVAAVYLLARRRNQLELAYAFGLGYFLHLLVDLYGPLLTGHNTIDTAFLFWPLVTEYPLRVMPPPIPVAKSTVFSTIVIVAFGLWISDGLPVVADIADVLSALFSD